MSVFKKRKTMTPVTNQASHVCSHGHVIDGIKPTINPSIMQIQHPEWIGRTCSCQRLIYNEGHCYCPNPENQHWEIHWQPNPNY